MHCPDCLREPCACPPIVRACRSTPEHLLNAIDALLAYYLADVDNGIDWSVLDQLILELRSARNECAELNTD